MGGLVNLLRPEKASKWLFVHGLDAYGHAIRCYRSVLAPAGIVDLQSSLDLFESFLLSLALHMNAWQFLCLGNPGIVIVLVYDEFSHI
jgi:hypothetical protein